MRTFERIREKEFQERSLWKREELGHERISCCNSQREYGVYGDGVKRESLAYKTECILF